MSYFSKRALRWAAPVALVGALGLAACGDNDDTEAVRVAAPSAAGIGSDQHLNNKAEELARASAGVGSDQHLNNKAVELAEQEFAYRAAASVGSDQHLENMSSEIASARANRAASARLTGQAEQVQRAQAARLTAQAEQYERSAHIEGQANTYSSIEVGNRSGQMAQAEQYVEQQQDRADSSHSILPGSHHVSTQ